MGSISHQRVNTLPLISFGTGCDACSFGLNLLIILNLLNLFLEGSFQKKSHYHPAEVALY